MFFGSIEGYIRENSVQEGSVREGISGDEGEAAITGRRPSHSYSTHRIAVCMFKRNDRVPPVHTRTALNIESKRARRGARALNRRNAPAYKYRFPAAGSGP